MSDKSVSTLEPKPNCLDSFKIYDLKNYLLKPSVHDKTAFQLDYSFIWVEQGTGEIFIDSQPFLIASNELIFLRPGQQFSCATGMPWNGFILSFAAEFLDLHETTATNHIQESLFNHLLVTPVIKLKDDTTRFMRVAVAKMDEEFRNVSPYKQEMLKGFLKIFIIYTSRAANSTERYSKVPKKIALVQQFYLLIEKYFITKKLVKEYAEVLHVTASYLNEAVREFSGATPSYHIQQRIIREAKRKICFEGSSMKEIGFSLGFCDQAHFSKYFKNISGKNFTDFRKEIIP